MQSKYVLTMDDVKKIAAASEAEATENRWSVTISVVDDGGNPLWLQRLDGAAPISAFVAQAKAKSAALGRRETKGYEDMINKGRFAFITAPNLEGMLEGGVPIEVDGQCLGAVGVSGVKSTEDAQIAKAGIAAFRETSIK
jgi:glc operon protein GlcG